jgi:hypothetical protein
MCFENLEVWFWMPVHRVAARIEPSRELRLCWLRWFVETYLRELGCWRHWEICCHKVPSNLSDYRKILKQETRTSMKAIMTIFTFPKLEHCSSSQYSRYSFVLDVRRACPCQMGSTPKRMMIFPLACPLVRRVSLLIRNFAWKPSVFYPDFTFIITYADHSIYISCSCSKR